MTLSTRRRYDKKSHQEKTRRPTRYHVSAMGWYRLYGRGNYLYDSLVYGRFFGLNISAYYWTYFKSCLKYLLLYSRMERVLVLTNIFYSHSA